VILEEYLASTNMSSEAIEIHVKMNGGEEKSLPGIFPGAKAAGA
jgi:hypothetical protein